MTTIETAYRCDASCARPALHVHGDLDLFEADRFGIALTRLVDQAVDGCVVNLAGVGFIDSAGIHALLRAHSAAKTKGVEMVIQAPSARMERVFEASGIDHLMPVASADASG